MKRYERFANLLNTLIDSADLHKNEMIRNPDIDRSSYFRILRGDRLPTRSQYRKLKRILVLEKNEEISLDDLYDRMALGEDACDDIALVRSLLQQLADAQTGTVLREVEAGIEEVLIDASAEGVLDFCMPSVLGFQSLLLIKRHISGDP